MSILETSITVNKACSRYMKNTIIVKKDSVSIKYKQKLRGSKNDHVESELPHPVESRSKTHWTGECGSFEDKKKRRPPNVLVENLTGGGWKSDDFDSNSYCGSRGSYLGNTNDQSSCEQGDAYLGQNSV